MPIGLRHHADPKPGRFEQAAQQGHGETRMVNVGIARDEHHIDRIPTPPVHLVGRHRQRRLAGGRGSGRLQPQQSLDARTMRAIGLGSRMGHRVRLVAKRPAEASGGSTASGFPGTAM